jgi:aminoglycoside/choline kinase family phosphotransferase
MEKLRDLYVRWRGEQPADVVHLDGAGSNRAYYRLLGADGSSVIGCVGTSREENHAFVYLAGHFTALQLPVPEILAVDDDEMRYLQTDLGSTSLFDALKSGREAGGRYNPQEVDLLRQTMSLLPRLQFLGAQDLDFSVCYPQPAFDEMGVMFDLNYFKYCYLKATGVDFHEVRLEEDFRQLARDLTAHSGDTFLYRDFQARNVMLVDGQPYFIDFQGGRKGPYYYDLASFLWQASARYPYKVRRELVYEY